ncbi:MAG TPA: hypothetical protein VG405_01925 [Solirubrobacteraceae bacterium]|nr:hypothetical protein [Solirubrobacteraceae bacterium]
MTDPLPASRSSAAFKQAIVGGYDREEVDDYVAALERHIDELEREHTPDGAVQRRLEQVGGEVSGILQRAHETADQLTHEARTEADQLLESARREAEELRTSAQRETRELTENARREADERIGASHRDAAQITANAQTRLQELDVDADRIWSERERILTDVRFLSQQLLEVAETAAQRFPADEAEAEEDPGEITAATSELPELRAGVELLPGEAGDLNGATQAYDVEELFEGQDDLSAGELPPGSKGEVGEGPELAGN